MARKKPQVEIKKIKSLQEADEILHRIADLRAKLKSIDAKTEVRINEIKERAAKEAEPYLQEIAALEKSLAVYSEYNREDLFKEKKSIELTFGLFGFRQSTSISVKKDTLDLLKEFGFTDAIKVKETVNKEAMREWSEEKLAMVHARRVVKDSFWYEVKENLKEVKHA